MLNTVKNAMHTIGDSTGDLVRGVGCNTVSLARRIGPKRALLGVAILGAMVGGSIWLARYLRARKEERPVEAGLEADGDQGPGRAQKRPGKHGAEQYSH